MTTDPYPDSERRRCVHCDERTNPDTAHSVHVCNGDDLDGWPCDCDEVSCPACCIECNAVAVIPGQEVLL